MALREKLEVIVDANVQGFVRGMDKAGAAADKNLGKTDEKLAVMSGRLTSWGAAMAGAGAVGAVGLGKLAMMAADAEKQQLKLSNSVKNSSNSFKSNGAALREQASELQKFTAAEDDAVVGAQAMLVQFGLTEQQVTDLTPLMVDLSRKMGVDLDAAAKAVGKSATGTTTALKRMGIDVEALGEGSTAAEKTVSALSKSVGGFAAAEGKTFSGQLQIIKNQLGELGEGVGSGVLDIVKPLTELGVKLNDISPQAANTTGKILAIGTAGATAAGGLAFLVGQGLKIRDTFTTAEGSLTKTGSALKMLSLAGGAAVGLLALDAALTAVTTSSSAAETTINELAASTNTEASLAKLIERTKELDGGWNDVKQTFSQTGELGQYVKLNGINTDITNLDKVLSDLAQSKNWPALRNAIAALKDAQVSQGDSDWLTGGSGGPEGVANFAGIVDKYSGSLKAADSAAQAAASGTGGFADAVAEGGEVAAAAAESWQEYADAIKATTDPYFAVIDASGKLESAQKGATEAFAAFADGATPEELLNYRDAQLGVVQAGLGLQGSLAQLQASVAAGDTSLAAANQTLDNLAASFPDMVPSINVARDAINGVKRSADALPNQKELRVRASVVGMEALQAARSFLDGLRDKNVSVRFNITGGQTQASLNAQAGRYYAAVPGAANGGITSYAGGGTRLPSQAMIQPGRGGGLVQWAEGETGGEAFIPLAPSKRGRSKDLWVETGKRLGILPMADGGIRSFGFGGFSADDYTGQLVEQMNNFWQAQFDTASLGRQAELAATRRDVLQPWSDEWVKWNNIAVDSLQKLAAEQSDIAEKAAADQREAMERNAAAAKDIADNQFDWMYDHASDLEKLQIAISRRDSFGQFTDDWVQWAKEVESLQMAGVGTARSTASGGKSQGSAPFYLTVNVNAEGLVTSPVAVGSQVVEAIRAFERTAGTSWRS